LEARLRELEALKQTELASAADARDRLARDLSRHQAEQGVRDRELQATKEANKKELEARAAALTDAQAAQRKVRN
jgi:hypothetical protein